MSDDVLISMVREVAAAFEDGRKAEREDLARWFELAAEGWRLIDNPTQAAEAMAVAALIRKRGAQ